MAQFDNLNTAIEALDGSIDDLVKRLEAATVEDPAVQASIDEAVTRINDVRARVEAIAGETPTGDEPHVEHR